MARKFGARLTIRADGLGGRQADFYEAQLLGMLAGLNATQTGHAILNGFLFFQKDVLIYPYDGRLGPNNARTYEDWGLFGTKVSFTPLEAPHSRWKYAGHSPHEILIHELTHAVRSVAGKLYSSRGDDISGPKGVEEDIAVLVTNIFSSETNRPLRIGYYLPDENAPADVPEAGDKQREWSQTIADHLEDSIYQLCNDTVDFARWLGRVKAPFNPVRDYFNHAPGQGWNRAPGW